MLLLPVVEILLRTASKPASPAPAIVQHPILIVGMLGGAIAAVTPVAGTIAGADLAQRPGKRRRGFSATVSPPPSAFSFSRPVCSMCWR
jgi:hypothetical protein